MHKLVILSVPGPFSLKPQHTFDVILDALFRKFWTPQYLALEIYTITVCAQNDTVNVIRKQAFVRKKKTDKHYW